MCSTHSRAYPLTQKTPFRSTSQFGFAYSRFCRSDVFDIIRATRYFQRTKTQPKTCYNLYIPRTVQFPVPNIPKPSILKIPLTRSGAGFLMFSGCHWPLSAQTWLGK